MSDGSVRKPLVSGNWKMNHNHLEAIQTVQKLGFLLGPDDYEAVDVSVHPPFTDIRSVQTTIEGDKNIQMLLGAQNCWFEDKGAFTGEVAPGMLAKLFVSYVIVGHSERREVFGETDEWVNNKVKAVIKHGMTPIMCCGETLEEREADETFDKIRRQVVAGLQGVSKSSIGSMVIAYEPIWAIGTGKTATAEDAQSVCAFVRSTVAEAFGAECAASVRIQYGGSVKAANAAELMAQPDIDGLLVGGASLDADEFARICKFRQSGLNAVMNAAETGEVPEAVKVVPDLQPPALSPADMSAEWLVNGIAAFAARTDRPLDDDDLTMLKTPNELVAEHAEMQGRLGELHNRIVILVRNGIDQSKQSGTVQQVEVRKGLRIPQDWAYHLKIVTDAHQPWLVCSIIDAALNRNLLAGERRDWKSK